MSNKKDEDYDPRWDWSLPESHDFCHSAPEAGLHNDDLRLWRLGLDPDKQTSLDILIELKKRMAAIQRHEGDDTE